ncbi:hypothetical protein MTR67_047069 [Solanum verrucosum]|uniref:Exocyst subunit Exo70 family protein n=1 Tax=Solanum verrucosum TaxID=315347 RepID=A0AAF0UY49_SOLVR|nr:hypothetical protein MTR67_047069 [Solanum verrucosum]
MLEQLFLGWLDELKEIPESIGDILTLNLIQIGQCTSALENSAKRIQEEMLIRGTCICIVIRYRPTGISTWNVRALQTNLDGKSKQYKDPSLTNLFLMNNIHYMVRSVRRSESQGFIG